MKRYLSIILALTMPAFKLYAGDQEDARAELVTMLNLPPDVSELDLAKAYKAKIVTATKNFRSLLVETWAIYNVPSDTEMNSRRLQMIRKILDQMGFADGLLELFQPSRMGEHVRIIPYSREAVVFVADEFNLRMRPFLDSQPPLSEVMKVFKALSVDEIGYERRAKFFERLSLVRYGIDKSTDLKEASEILINVLPCVDDQIAEIRELSLLFENKFRHPFQTRKEFLFEILNAQMSPLSIELISYGFKPYDARGKVLALTELYELVQKNQPLNRAQLVYLEVSIKKILSANPDLAEEFRNKVNLFSRFFMRLDECDRILNQFARGIYKR